MNSKIYNIVVLLLFSSLGLMAQSQKKYQKTFPVDKTTKLMFKTQNIDVTFKTWNRDEVKVDFVVNFKNYTDEEIQKISNEIIVATRMESTMGDTNYLQIENTSPTKIGEISYTIKSGEIRVENFFDGEEKPDQYRSVANINQEIDTRGKGWDEMDGYIVFENDKVALKDLVNSTNKNIQIIRSSYEIYVPATMVIDLLADNANITIDSPITNAIRGSFKDSTLEAAELSNKENAFSFVNGNIRVKKIDGGRFLFRNVTRGLIGQIANVNLETEFSKIDIGKIEENVEIRDFKSKFFFYNLASNFKSIDMHCEYSDIKMYSDKKQKFYMKAVGNNAVLNDGGTKIIAQPSRDGTKSTIFTRGKDDEETRKNFFKLDIVHGFVTFLHK